MRFITFILSIYVLALSVVSCADDIESHSDGNKVEVSVSQDEHNHSENCTDFCSPFCTCACCGTVITLVSNLNVFETNLISLPKYLFHYSFEYSFNYNIGVWRPPNLG